MVSDIPYQPVRKVRPNFRSSTGTYCSIDKGPMDFESKIERNTYLLLDFVPNIVKLVPQPTRLGQYVPDCLVMTPSRSMFVEIKYIQELVKKWDVLGPKYIRAEETALQNGFEFGLITDDVLRPFENRISVLWTIRQCGRPKSEHPEIRETIITILKNSKSKTIQQLIHENPEFAAAIIIAETCKAITSRACYVKETPSPTIYDTELISAEQLDPTFDYLTLPMTLDEFQRKILQGP